ncbi:retromer subunit VPS17 Ecym_2320 [Eremothecium cymbalariae DBVPG|uniref:Vacuolar protein sorting-associated protein 17 n=1 Tax=Eremothecium cymbalariae (strain CBS 270.75 / DBVPG 7215 / KCTC 17166 / NRRL Y-17582) TaxID=931890 RepID=G8JQ60_ERECY|nr:Hypothetical protein Ecym_2320 [Eremothecium cymbalariae DBVPG\
MASTVPYDAYDNDVDNNPFSEPSEENLGVAVANNEEAGAVVDTGAPAMAGTPKDLSANVNADSQSLPDFLPERKSKKYHIVAKITGLERTGSLTARKESPTIIFDVSTNLPTFRKSQHKNVKKTYDEFQALFNYLSSAVPETFVCALPPPSTSFGINNNEDMQKTLKNFSKWIDKVCNDPLLIVNEELAYFIESDFNTYTPMSKAKQPASGLRRKTMKQLPPPYDEVVELAEFRPLVKSIYIICQEVQNKLLRMSKARKQLSQEENAFGQNFHNLSVDDERHSKLYRRFGKVITAVGDIDSVMATFEMATLYDDLKWIVQDSYIVKETLTNRHFLMKELLQAQQNTKMKQDSARRLRAKRDISPLKVDDAIRQLKLATKSEHELTVKLQRVTHNMLIEKQNWMDSLVDSLASTVKEYTLKKIEYERKKLTLLERVRSDVRNVDTQGGLSRLGREQLVSSPTLNPSQSAIQGDSWTADRRASHCIENTEFDITIPHLTHSPEPSPDTQDLYTGPIDARQAATILGTSTF